MTSDIGNIGRLYKYRTPSFLPFINMVYSTPRRMQAMRQFLLDSQFYTESTIGSIAWGENLQNVIPQHLWPGNTGKYWRQHVSSARSSLQTVRNNQNIDGSLLKEGDDDTTAPQSRLQLLDALTAMCFTRPASGETLAGIPIVSDVSTKPSTDANRDVHDIVFSWELGPDRKPVCLYLTMICPFGS